MSKGCSVDAHVRNSNGEVVKSTLFRDLLTHLSNRKTAKGYYAVGTNREFLDRVRNKEEYREDENGEITFNSLRKLTGMNVEQEKLLTQLNKDLGAGVYEYNNAVAKLSNFNRESQFKEDYMATIEHTNKGYALSVVPRTTANEVALEQTIAQRSLQDRIIYYLNKAGVGVEFIEQDDKEGGRYSTINATKTADGLYNLIRVSKGENIEENLAEEAGHFAVGALGSSPLVQRLTSLLTSDVQKEILGDEYETKALGAQSEREVAGVLVGKALLNNIDQQSAWGRLATRIAEMAKRIFATISGNDVMKATIDAQRIARNIARNFMSNEQQGSLDEALAIRETLFSAPTSMNTQAFRTTINSLKLAVSKLKAISDDEYVDKVNNVLLIAASGRINTINLEPEGPLKNTHTLEGITAALEGLLDLIGPGKEITELLDSVDFLNAQDFYGNMAENGRKLRQVREFATVSNNLQKQINQWMSHHTDASRIQGELTRVHLTDDTGHTRVVNLTKIVKDLGEMNTALITDLATKEKQFFIKFCEDSLGTKYVYRAARVIWNIGKSKQGRGLTRRVKGGNLSIAAQVEHLDHDINIFERFIGSMANNPDIIGQVVDKVTKAANKHADDLTNRDWDNLRVLEQRFKNLNNISQRDLYETFDDGTMTGNLISEVNWGQYEKNRKEFIDSEFDKFLMNEFLISNRATMRSMTDDEKKAFIDKNFDSFKKRWPKSEVMSDFEKGDKWDHWLRPALKDWNKIKGNGKWDNVRQRYVPNPAKYANPKYDELKSKDAGFEAWYNDYMSLKESIDSRLPEGSTLWVRAPQFKGTYTNIVKNNKALGVKDAHGSALRMMLRETFCESSEDTDYGSEQTYNSEEEEIFGNALSYDKEKIHRLPLYGIRKLNDMTELSTDLFHTTLSYSGMANSHFCLSQIVDTLEVGHTFMQKQRTVEGKQTEEGRKKHSNAYRRYTKFLDKQVYGISSTKHKIAKGIILEKIAAFASGFASKYFLGGNVVGGMVNTMTGFNEIFKEAIADEYFSLKDFTMANKLYYGKWGKNFVQNWAEYGKEFRENKVGLFIRHFNVLGDNRQKQRDWHTEDKSRRRIYKGLFEEALFLPYKSGDHWMQSISYLALANKTKLYDENGNKISLFNAYNKVGMVGKNYREDYSKGVSKDLFKNDADHRKFIDLNQIVIKLQSSDKVDVADCGLTPAQQSMLRSMGLSGLQKQNLINKLISESDALVNIDSSLVQKAVGLNRGSSLEMSGKYFKSKDGKKEYDMINSIISKMEASRTALFTGGGLVLTSEEQKFMNDKGYNLADTDNTIYKLGLDRDKLVWNVDDESAYMDKCREINNRLHGIYNNQDKTAFHQSWWGNAILAMRGYALGMMERRFGENHYSVATGQDVEGTLNTMAKLWLSDMSMWSKINLTLMPFELMEVIGLPITRKAKLEMYKAGFSANQYANLRRNWGDYMLILGLWMLRCLSAAPDDDDNVDSSELNIGMGRLHYFSSRLFWEQAAFNWPPAMMTEASTTVLNMIPAGASAFADVAVLAYQAGGVPFADSDNSEFFYQREVPGKYEEGDSKAEKHFWRMFPYIRSYYPLFVNPYDATKSYEYGKRVKVR